MQFLVEQFGLVADVANNIAQLSSLTRRLGKTPSAALMKRIKYLGGGCSWAQILFRGVTPQNGLHRSIHVRERRGKRKKEKFHFCRFCLFKRKDRSEE